MSDPYSTTYKLLNVIQLMGFLSFAAGVIGSLLLWNELPTFDLIAIAVPSILAGLLLMAAGQVGAAILNISRDIRALRQEATESNG
ncbi:hypothetical protein [Limimaricola cinnabarinus]|uniref:hypothetical protein n=1 Tax=Limimaricola cinnabarinus TaxID=1125964 RepID=UPI002FE2584D